MLRMKTIPLFLGMMFAMNSAFALEDVEVKSEKFNLLNGMNASIEKYFVSENGFDSLHFSANGSTIMSEPAIRSYLPNISRNPRLELSKYAYLGGECAVFVQNMTNARLASNWRAGDKVTGYWNGNALVGKTIATFDSGGRYENNPKQSHVAIVIAAWRSAPGSGPIDSVWVLDSNYVKGAGNRIIGRHRIDTRGSSKTTNLNNYYIVKQ